MMSKHVLQIMLGLLVMGILAVLFLMVINWSPALL